MPLAKRARELKRNQTLLSAPRGRPPFHRPPKSACVHVQEIDARAIRYRSQPELDLTGPRQSEESTVRLEKVFAVTPPEPVATRVCPSSSHLRRWPQDRGIRREGRCMETVIVGRWSGGPRDGDGTIVPRQSSLRDGVQRPQAASLERGIVAKPWRCALMRTRLSPVPSHMGAL